MTRKIFLSIMAAAAVVLLCSVLIIMGCLYDYFGGVQERQLEDELALAQTGVECSGKTYLKALEGESYRLTWIAPSGEVLFDSQADESRVEVLPEAALCAFPGELPPTALWSRAQLERIIEKLK